MSLKPKASLLSPETSALWDKWLKAKAGSSLETEDLLAKLTEKERSTMIALGYQLADHSVYGRLWGEWGSLKRRRRRLLADTLDRFGLACISSACREIPLRLRAGALAILVDLNEAALRDAEEGGRDCLHTQAAFAGLLMEQTGARAQRMMLQRGLEQGAANIVNMFLEPAHEALWAKVLPEAEVGSSLLYSQDFGKRLAESCPSLVPVLEDVIIDSGTPEVWEFDHGSKSAEKAWKDNMRYYLGKVLLSWSKRQPDRILNMHSDDLQAWLPVALACKECESLIPLFKERTWGLACKEAGTW